VAESAESAAEPSAPSSARVVFAIPEFRWLYAGNFAFFLAMGSQAVVRQALAYDLTGSKVALGTVAMISALPMFVLAPIGGGLADRIDRRKVILGGQCAVVLAELVMLTLLWTDRLRFVHLIVLSAAMGGVFPFVMPSRQAIVANLVGRQRLATAMALTMAAINTSRVVGPALGGFLLHGLGAKLTYTFGTLLYALAVLFTLRISPSRAEPHLRARSIWASVREGVHYIRSQPLLIALLFFGLVPPFLAMPFQSMLVVFAREVWHTGDAGFGMLSAAVGLGGILGSALVALRGDAHDRARRQLASMTGFGVLLGAFAYSPRFWPAVALLVLANACAQMFQTLNNTAIHLLIPDAMRGRVSAFLLMSFSLPMLGALPLGAAAEEFGVRAAIAGACGLAVAFGWTFFALSPGLRGLDASVRQAMAAET
jgi:MFS family permease